MNRLNILIVAILFLLTTAGCAQQAERWSTEKANAWYASQKWPVGINYVTATAINQFEMWQEETFDPKTMELELGRAGELGFNTVRIFLHDMVWEADPAGFKQRLDTFLGICQKHGMRAIVTFFTNGGRFESRNSEYNRLLYRVFITLNGYRVPERHPSMIRQRIRVWNVT